MSFAYAPWTEVIVENLRRRQEASWLHPYTCGADSGHGVVVPTRDGWVCPECGYVQNWAHQRDADGVFPQTP